ncbi:MAG TPA: cytochrome c peroxidase [Pirellulales bacterium]|nr:cytochrome c peroxidase [Pirellulales bacterium]
MRLLLICLVAGTAAIGCGTSTQPPKPASAPQAGVPATAPGTEASKNEPDQATGHEAAAQTTEGKGPSAQETRKVMLGDPELTAGIPGEGDLTVEQVKGWLDDPRNHEALDFDLPLGLATGRALVKGVEADPLTRAKIELGRQLFFEPRLSRDASVSCASCHSPDHGYAAETRFGLGIGGQTGGRNSPVAFNRLFSDKQFWDGRAPSLEDQALGPIANPIEMGNTHEACLTCLKAVPEYELQFNKIFGRMTIENVGEALGSFERALVTGPSPFDYYEQFRPFENQDIDDLDDEDKVLYDKVKTDLEAHPMSESARRGREIFFTDKGSCTACHVGPNLSDELYHNLGIGMDAGQPDLGRYVITNEDKDRGAFKTPTIRNVTLTAPYMHDGSLKTLEEVVEWYNKGGHPNPHLDPKIKKLNLSEQDQKDLVEFMKACESPLPKVERGRLPK